MRRLLPVLVLAVLAACRPEAGEDGSSAERQCLAEGGRPVVAPISGGSLCGRPTADAGKACAAAGDCAGYCLADTRSCSAEDVVLGCVNVLDAEGREDVLCVE